MMLCSKCGAKVNELDSFCEECGAALKKVEFPKSYVTVCDSNLASVTNIGRKHPTNEDAGTILKCENGDHILIVADGVSSSISATSASQKAINIISEEIVKRKTSVKELITAAINLADASIKELPYETREDGAYGPEATIVTAIVHEDTVTIGWAGDSRAYLLSSDKQELLTVDDSWVELVVATGSITREQASMDKRAHFVTQVLGMHDQDLEVHLIEREIKKGDMLLLCSDGLWNYFQSEQALLKAVEHFGTKSEVVNICEHLVELANSAGGHDNITVALLRHN